MSNHRLRRFLATLVLGMGLAALPFAVSLDGLDEQPAFAKNGGKGGGNGGGNGGGRGGGQGNGKGGGHGNAKDGGSGGVANDNSARQNGAASSAANASLDDRPGKALGHAKKNAASADATAGDITIDTPHPSSLGRLNGFMNASPEALTNAAPNSAIGVVARDYREALAAYAASIAAAPEGAVVVDPALDAAAKALALAANKTLTPDIVAAVNAHLAETYADDPALAGFADPESVESVEAAEAIAARAEGYQEQEASEGLGFASPEGMGDTSGEETQAVVIE